MKAWVKTNIPNWAFLYGYMLVSYVPFLFLPENYQEHWLFSELGYYEILTALAFAACSVIFFLAYRLECTGNDFGILRLQRNIFLILLAAAFFIGAGEELSWGQHLIGYETPESVAKRNNQGEFNFHNRDDLPIRIGLMFSIFWFSYCVCVPILVSVLPFLKRLLQRVNLPIVPLWLGLTFLLNYLLSKIVVPITGAVNHDVVEVKESNFAVLFLLVSLIFYRRAKSTNPRARGDKLDPSPPPIRGPITPD